MTAEADRVRAWRKTKHGTEPPYHGTASIYLNYACRCPWCRAANATRQRNYYHAKKGNQ